MKITGISRKISHGNFANTSLFADVEEGDDLQECYNDLTKKIHNLAGIEDRAKHLHQEIGYLERRVESLKEDEKIGLEKKEKIEQWMKKFNIPVDAFLEDETPF